MELGLSALVLEGIPHLYTEIFLPGIQILRPDSFAARPLSGRDDHSIVEMHTVDFVRLYRSANDSSIGDYKLDRGKRIENSKDLI